MRVTRFFAQTFDIYGNSMFATLNFGTIRKKFVRKHCFTKIFIFVCFGFKSYQPYNCCFLDPLTFFLFRKSWIGQYLVFLSVLRQSITVVLNIWFVPADPQKNIKTLFGDSYSTKYWFWWPKSVCPRPKSGSKSSCWEPLIEKV